MTSKLEKNRRNRENIKQKISENNSELENIKHLLDRKGNYWDNLNRQINEYYEKILHPLEVELSGLETELKLLEEKILLEASLVCSTLVKSSYDENLLKCNFDVLVVDEVSMVSLPQLYCTSALVSGQIVLCGDHLQLQPIATSEAELAKKWLHSSFFDFIENGDENYLKHRRLNRLKSYLSCLSTQRRMPKSISDLVKHWYEDAGNPILDGKLNASTQIQLSNHFLDERAIYFLDTSSIGSYHSRTSGKSPYNLINAAIAAELIRELIEDHQVNHDHISYLSPYRAQFQLTWAILKKFLRSDIQVRKTISNGVHKMQGSENDIVIYDLTDGRQNNFLRFIKTSEPHIHNVAITRSKSKLIFLGDMFKLQKLRTVEPPSPSFIDVLRGINKNAKIVDAKLYYDKIFKLYTVNDLLDDFTVRLTEEQRNNLVILDSTTYYSSLMQDIADTQNSLFMVSPFVTPNRWKKLKPSFQLFKESNPDGIIEIVSKPPDQMFESNNMNMAAVKILNEFVDCGYKVKVSKKVHGKLVILDRGKKNAITYFGSLNPLSFRNTDEINARIEGRELAERFYELSMGYQLHPYKKEPLRKDKIRSHIIIMVRVQLRNLRFNLAGIYHRPTYAICSNKTIEDIIDLVPSRKEDFFKIKEFNRRNFVLWNHLDEIKEIISPLEEP